MYQVVKFLLLRLNMLNETAIAWWYQLIKMEEYRLILFAEVYFFYSQNALILIGLAFKSINAQSSTRYF